MTACGKEREGGGINQGMFLDFNCSNDDLS